MPENNSTSSYAAGDMKAAVSAFRAICTPRFEASAYEDPDPDPA
jgi:hypothetical protein